MAISTKISRTGVWLLFGVLWVAGAQSAACSPQFHSCYDTRTCRAESQDQAGAAGDESDGTSGGLGHLTGGASGSGRAGAGDGGRETGDGGSAGEAKADSVGGGAASDAKAGSGGAAGAAGGEPEAPHCGDGSIDGDETCDDGTNNGRGKACNGQCQANVCGDGDKGPGEGCDDGAENGLELLRCAPDCSRIIEIKHVIFGLKEFTSSNLQPNPVAAADSACPIGYKAFFAHGTTRRATTTPFKAQNSIDWVIRPYTYYYNDHENPLWLTDSVPLLGVRDGKFAGLQNKISSYIATMVTGLNPDFTTLGINNCQGWSSLQSSDSLPYGLAFLTDAGFIYSDVNPCGSASIYFYCVEQ